MSAASGTVVKVVTGGATSLTTGTMTSATGQTFWISVSDSSGGTGPSSVSDSKGNTYTQVGSTQVSTADLTLSLSVYTCPNGTGGASHTATVNFAASQNAVVLFGNITGADASSIDTASAAQTQTGSLPATITSGTFAQADTLALCAVAWGVGGTPVYSESTGFSIIGQENDANTYYCSCVGAKSLAATAAITPSWNNDIGGNRFLLTVIGIKSLVTAGAASVGGKPGIRGPKFRRRVRRNEGSNAAAPSIDTPVSPGVGSLVLTGYAPTIAQPQTAAPGVGTLTLTGYAPSVVQNTNVAPGVGSLTITGFAPTVAQPQAVNPGAGALVLTGYAPVVSQPQGVLPGAGSITITGYAPTVAQAAGQNVAPGVGALAITGYAPSIAQPQTASPGAGSIAITGYAPGVVQNTQVGPGAGSVALTGYAPAVTQQINVTAGAGLLTLTGYAPVIAQTANQAVAPGVGALAISGFAPTVVQASASISLTPGIGQITITGHAPDVQQSVDQRTTGAGSDIGGGAERRPRYWHDAQRKPLLQRVLEARAEERRVKPIKERQRKRAKEVEVEAAKVVLRATSADGGEERFGELMRQWLAQRPVLPGGADAMAFFLAQVAFRLAQMDALDKAAAAFAAMDDDEEALLALLLL